MVDPATAGQPEGAAGGGHVPVDQLSFDDAFAELQRTIAELEAGGQPLETAIALHERAAALLERCDRLLAEAELRVRQLVTKSGGGLQAVDVGPGGGSDQDG